MNVVFSACPNNISLSVIQKKLKKHLLMKQSERPTFGANLQREPYRAKKETGGLSSRFLQNRSIGQLIVLFIVFMVSVQNLNVTLEHFGITPV
tara:strand:+ start:207 stop:485 length:279 start_codon:yes stop_codon:yes gene_type:complete